MFHFKADIISLKIMNYHYRLWRLAGLWSLPTDRIPYRIYAHTIHIICFFVFNIHILLSLGQAKDMSTVVDILLPATTTVLISTKAIFFMHKQRHFTRIFELMRLLESSPIINDGTNSAADILLHTKRSARKLLIVISFACDATITMSFVMAAISAHRRLMWIAWFPFDWEHAESSAPYWMAITFQYACTSYIGVLYSTCDMCAPSMYSILSGFLDILGQRLQRIGHHHKTSAENAGESNEEEKMMAEQQLYQCVQYHNLCVQ